MGDITELLRGVENGDDLAESELVELVYDTLHTLAKKTKWKNGAGRLQQTTALIHEAYLRIRVSENVWKKNRGYFFGAVARAMEQYLIDLQRREGRQKRGGRHQRVTIDELDGSSVHQTYEIDYVELSDALDAIARQEPRPVQVFRYRYFGALSFEEVATIMGISKRSVERDWRTARVMLRQMLAEDV